MTTVTQNGIGGPWWVRLATQVGIPSVIALYLVYALVEGVQASLERHEAAAAARIHALTVIMRQICANTAETAIDRAQCFVSGSD